MQADFKAMAQEYTTVLHELELNGYVLRDLDTRGLSRGSVWLRDIGVHMVPRSPGTVTSEATVQLLQTLDKLQSLDYIAVCVSFGLL